MKAETLQKIAYLNELLEKYDENVLKVDEDNNIFYVRKEMLNKWQPVKDIKDFLNRL